MHGDRYRNGGSEQPNRISRMSLESDRRSGDDHVESHENRQTLADGRERPKDPLLDIARHDERHHYGRQSVEHRRERLNHQRRDDEDEQFLRSRTYSRRRYGSPH